ncbi:hypothetical protein KR767_07025 [Luteibacter anthropi]|uniref:hypothetical protein n=1 Tax=Luteibacter anthropi TaxID=564369 RepID=UPI0020325671|nr:hypothetical protein [Luteibacter anthropi]URX63800.1 hypothetical protein KR767_07025 [Luteibacter anthropi]
MNHIVRKALVALFVAAPAIAAAQVSTPAVDAPAIQPVPSRCGVTDLNEFAAFIAGKPTPAEFRAFYSCVGLVLPGDVTTTEIRYDNSRYFAQLDAHGRIVGGRFR